MYSATMQSSSQLLSGSYSGSYMTEGLFVHQSDSLWIEAVGQSAGPGADVTVSSSRGQSLEEMVRWVEVVL